MESLYFGNKYVYVLVFVRIIALKKKKYLSMEPSSVQDRESLRFAA